MEEALNEVMGRKTLILFSNTTHNSKFIDALNNFVLNYYTKAKLMDIITSKFETITSLKEDLVTVNCELVKKDDELLLVDSRIFEIHERLVKITE